MIKFFPTVLKSILTPNSESYYHYEIYGSVKAYDKMQDIDSLTAAEWPANFKTNMKVQTSISTILRLTTFSNMTCYRLVNKVLSFCNLSTDTLWSCMSRKQLGMTPLCVIVLTAWRH